MRLAGLADLAEFVADSNWPLCFDHVNVYEHEHVLRQSKPTRGAFLKLPSMRLVPDNSGFSRGADVVDSIFQKRECMFHVFWSGMEMGRKADSSAALCAYDTPLHQFAM